MKTIPFVVVKIVCKHGQCHLTFFSVQRQKGNEELGIWLPINMCVYAKAMRIFLAQHSSAAVDSGYY